MINDPDAPLSGSPTEMFHELMRRLEVAHAELDQQLIDAESASAESDKERAESARRGELGPDWRDVQRRIDANETTLERVFSGEDTSAAARNLRALSSRNLDSLRDALDDQDSDDGATKPEQFESVIAESRERHAQAAEHIQHVIDDLRKRGAGI